MANFKELTRQGGEKIIINVDEILTMQRQPDATTIHFSKDHVVHVEELPADILADPIDRRL
ncbi:flagellar FlbD family protein [Bradyrhizobium sp. 31Argb]|uniref:flagellar FlbD family protein n=1 Tax=Bradyrhizobium sp. 31Argb TaxID=3141247 RepID=UPI003748913E